MSEYARLNQAFRAVLRGGASNTFNLPEVTAGFMTVTATPAESDEPLPPRLRPADPDKEPRPPAPLREVKLELLREPRPVTLRVHNNNTMAFPVMNQARTDTGIGRESNE